MRSKRRRRRRRRRSRRAGQNKNNPLEKAWDGKGYSKQTHPKEFAGENWDPAEYLPIKLAPLARRRGMNNDNRVALTLNPRSRLKTDISNAAYWNTTRKERKAREKEEEAARKKEQIKKFVRTFRAQRRKGRSGGRRRRRSRRRRRRSRRRRR